MPPPFPWAAAADGSSAIPPKPPDVPGFHWVWSRLLGWEPIPGPAPPPPDPGSGIDLGGVGERWGGPMVPGGGPKTPPPGNVWGGTGGESDIFGPPATDIDSIWPPGNGLGGPPAPGARGPVEPGPPRRGGGSDVDLGPPSRGGGGRMGGVGGGVLIGQGVLIGHAGLIVILNEVAKGMNSCNDLVASGTAGVSQAQQSGRQTKRFVDGAIDRVKTKLNGLRFHGNLPPECIQLLEELLQELYQLQQDAQDFIDLCDGWLASLANYDCGSAANSTALVLGGSGAVGKLQRQIQDILQGLLDQLNAIIARLQAIMDELNNFPPPGCQRRRGCPPGQVAQQTVVRTAGGEMRVVQHCVPRRPTTVL